MLLLLLLLLLLLVSLLTLRIKRCVTKVAALERVWRLQRGGSE
jgi:hypothetical protein